MKNNSAFMKTEILFDSHSTASNRYYDNKSSVQYSHIEVIRPVVKVVSSKQETIEVCKAEVQRNCDVIKR